MFISLGIFILTLSVSALMLKAALQDILQCLQLLQAVMWWGFYCHYYPMLCLHINESMWRWEPRVCYAGFMSDTRSSLLSRGQGWFVWVCRAPPPREWSYGYSCSRRCWTRTSKDLRERKRTWWIRESIAPWYWLMAFREAQGKLSDSIQLSVMYNYTLKRFVLTKLTAILLLPWRIVLFQQRKGLWILNTLVSRTTLQKQPWKYILMLIYWQF